MLHLLLHAGNPHLKEHSHMTSVFWSPSSRLAALSNVHVTIAQLSNTLICFLGYPPSLVQTSYVDAFKMFCQELAIEQTNFAMISMSQAIAVWQNVRRLFERAPVCHGQGNTHTLKEYIYIM